MLHLRIARRSDDRAAWDTLPGFAQVLTSLTVFSVAGTSSMIKFIAVVYGDQFAQSPVLIQKFCAHERCISEERGRQKRRDNRSRESELERWNC